MIKSILATILTILSIFILFKECKSISDDGKRLKEVVGKEIILNKDTLVITDYSLIKSEYTLSNGVTVAENFKFKFVK